QKRVDQDARIARLDAECRMAVPGDLHENSSPRLCSPVKLEPLKLKSKPAAQMPVIAIEDLPEHLTAGSTVAAIDIGTKTIGLAVADRSLAFAHPRPVIMRRKFTIDAEALLAALKRDGVAVLVAGLPINMDGSQGPRAQAARAFVSNLRRLTDMPMAFWDERLSTVAAERALIEM